MMEIKTVKDIAKFIRTGKTPPTQEIKYFNGEVNWYTPGDLDKGKYLSSAKRTLTKDAFVDKKAVVFPKNTLIVGCIGDIGKLGITVDECSSNQQLTGIFPNENVDVSYLYYWFRGNKSLIESYANNAVVPILNNRTLETIKIPLPPLPQQEKIAAILDAADVLRQNDKALLAKYDELTSALFLDMFGDPVSNPKGWEKEPLKQCTTKIGSGSTPRGGKETYLSEGIALVRSLNIYDNLFKYKNLAFISNEQADKLKNVILESNDVLFNITGASVCRCSIVPDDILPARVNQHVSILRPIKGKLSSSFLSHLLISENVKITLLGVGSYGGAVMEAITKEQLEKFEIIIPPFELQNQFMERVTLIEEQKAIAQKSLERSEELFNSLLQKAFKGELV
jgi:type I restriction enzyme S subunit